MCRKTKPDSFKRSQYPLGLPGFAYHAAAQVALIRGVRVADVLEANKDNVLELYGIDLDGGSDPAAESSPAPPAGNTVVNAAAEGVFWRQQTDAL